MKVTTAFNKWNEFNEKYNHIWSFIILTLVSMSFVLTDWLVGIFTFSDYIFGTILTLLLISGNYKVRRNQLVWATLLLILLILNIFMNFLYNDVFILKTGIAALIKIIFYTVVITGVYNYVSIRKLQSELLIILTAVAVLVCIIGIYITIAIYSDVLPYEFFWEFTRGDLASYTYGWNSALIRTKSIFSEPSYLGYYLNIILGITYFNNQKIKINKYAIALIILTIVLTFSYSSIGIMIFTLCLYASQTKKYKKIEWHNSYLLFGFPISLFLFLAWDLINQTIIQRTISILSGTDTSALNRLLNSWQYVNKEHIFIGNGINHTPDIWNNYAYILSDFGIILFIVFCSFSIYIVTKNPPIGILFIILNFQKGGYLSNSFWILLLLVFIYSNGSIKKIIEKNYLLDTLKLNTRR